MNYAITGFKGAGKDTAASALNFEYDYTKVSFADPLREIVNIAFGVTFHEMADRELKEASLRRWPFRSPRQLLQHVGTELFRNNYPGVWVNAWERNVLAAWGDGQKVVCTDMRFPDEVEAVKKLGNFTTIRVVNPKVQLSDVHESERYIGELPVDVQIVNDFSSAEEFKAYMKVWFKDHSERRIGR